MPLGCSFCVFIRHSSSLNEVTERYMNFDYFDLLYIQDEFFENKTAA
jgi:hypothetical protein